MHSCLYACVCLCCSFLLFSNSDYACPAATPEQTNNNDIINANWMAFMCFMEEGCCLNLYKYSRLERERGRGEKEWLWPARVATFCARNAPYPLHTKLKWVILNFEFPIKKGAQKTKGRTNEMQIKKSSSVHTDRLLFRELHRFAFVDKWAILNFIKHYQPCSPSINSTPLHSTLISSICNDTKQLAANLFVHLNPNKEKINM